MQISVFGRTDKRACIYTLMKVLQKMGDVALVSSNPQYRRLIEGDEDSGFYQNIHVFVLETTADELWNNIGHAPKDFDYVILDDIYNELTTLPIYIQGAGVEAEDEDLLETIEDMVVIKMGKDVPYKGLPENIEHIEYYRQFVVPSVEMLNILAKHLEPHLNMPAKNIVKVGSRK